ncbi:MAG TPA: hypothetical protein VF584_16105 [Longimicrobium sp.]|jgi:hypothetical protein
MSAIDQIYDQMDQVFGGNNPMQYFTLMMPGMVLDLETYAYDVAGEKPVRVADAESRLVNQLFDVCQVTGTSNGRQLSSQYLQALGKLVPRFDPALATVKTALRAYLAEPCTSVLEDGTTFTGTRQELYFVLYDAWALRKQAWQQLQDDQRQKFQAQFPKAPAAALSAYDEWFETVADANLMLVDAAEARVAIVLSPADMDAIQGVLEAGTGGEIEEARRNVTDVRLRSTSGGYVYPVDLSPVDWFESLVSDTDPKDLLDAPAYLALKLSARRGALSATISQVLSLLSSATGDVATLAQKLSDAQNAYGSAQNALLGTMTGNLATAADMYLASQQNGGATADPTTTDLDPLAGQVDATSDTPPSTPSTFTQADVDAIKNGQEALLQSQSAYLTAAQNLATSAQNLASAEATTYAGLEPYLARLQQQAQDLDTLWAQIGTSMASPPAASAAPASGTPSPAPQRSAASDRFMDLTFYFSSDDMSDSSSLQSSASQTSWSGGLFFGSAGGSSSSSSSSSMHAMMEANTMIEIGMQVMRVDVDRGWFDPGVFALTGDLESLNSTPIAGAPVTTWGTTPVAPAPAILPCYPVSFLVAKDITLKFQANKSQLNAARQVADSQSAVGGGFLCFSASHSESSHSESQSVTTSSSTSVLTIHIGSPQIIGWVMEFTPQDLSTQPSDGLSILQYLKNSETPVPAPAPGSTSRVPARRVPVPALVGSAG